MKGYFECDSKDQKAPNPPENMETPLKDPSPSLESKGEAEKIVQNNPAVSSNFPSNSNSNPPPPPPSLLLKFAKRVAICTAVVALVRYAYPKILVIYFNFMTSY